MDSGTQPSRLSKHLKRIRHTLAGRDPCHLPAPDAEPTSSLRRRYIEQDLVAHLSVTADHLPPLTFPPPPFGPSSASISSSFAGSTSSHHPARRRNCVSMTAFDPSASRLSFSSQVTLIDEAPLILKFNRRSASNVTLYSGSFPIYKVTTNKDGTKTEVYDVVGNETHICSIKRREFLPDVIKYRNRPSGSDVVKLASWLKYERIQETMTGVSFDTPCGQMTWRYGQGERYRMALYKSKDFSSPVAYLKNTDPNIPMLLYINPGQQELVEDILLSALIIEYKLKMYERLKKHDLLYGPLLGSLISLK